jgi:hypothetical protein
MIRLTQIRPENTVSRQFTDTLGCLLGFRLVRRAKEVISQLRT